MGGQVVGARDAPVGEVSRGAVAGRMPRWERSVQVSGSQSRFGRGVVSGCIENELRSQRLGSDAPGGSGCR